MDNSVKIKNFRISGLTIIGIAIGLMIFGGVLAIPSVDGKSSSSHQSKSSHISSSSNTGGKSNAKASQTTQTTSNNNILSSNGNNDKVVIINFDDSFKNQFLYAKPILDKYGFKATFFEVAVG